MEINTNISPEILSAKQNYSIVGNSPDLIAAIGQSLEEVILVVLVGVVLAIVIVIQRCWAEEGLLKGRFSEKSHMSMFGFQSYCFLSVRR